MYKLICLFLPLIQTHPLTPDSRAILTPFSNGNELVQTQIKALIQPKAVSFTAPFPDGGRKLAVLEQESILSMLDSGYGSLQAFVGRFFNQKPVVDVLDEKDKYGNDGEKFRSIGTAVVGKIEGVSNFLNAAVEVPFAAAKEIGRTITSSLNTVGTKLVGNARK